jgi:heme-degrading monooxygenase HmoA
MRTTLLSNEHSWGIPRYFQQRSTGGRKYLSGFSVLILHWFVGQSAKTPDPPYYAVIFTSRRTDVDDGYGATADLMEELAQKIPGYLGIESARGADGLGITVSYWKDEGAISTWRQQADHKLAQAQGREKWYEDYDVRIARVERAYRWDR